MVSTGSGNAVSTVNNGDRYLDGARVIEYLPPSLNAVPSSRYYLWLMAPALILLAAISLYPFFWLIWMSLQNVGSGPETEFVGLKNYIKLWTDPRNQKVVGNELVNGVEVPKTEVDMARFTPALISYTVTDEAGNRIFSDDDIDILSRSAQGPFLKLAEVARRLNGLSGEEVKNSEDSQKESSSSDSV